MSEKRGTVRPISAPAVTVETALEALQTVVSDPHRNLADALLRLCVNYRPRDARRTSAVEPGVITGVGTDLVFVRYWGNRDSKATTPECLTWAYPR